MKKRETKVDLEYRLLQAKVKINEAGAEVMIACKDFIPQLFKRLIQEFEKDFGSLFNPNKPVEAPKPIQVIREKGSKGNHFDVNKFEVAPCYLCGYNGQGYYDVGYHKCAELYHKFVQAEEEAIKHLNG